MRSEGYIRSYKPRRSEIASPHKRNSRMNEVNGDSDRSKRHRSLSSERQSKFDDISHGFTPFILNPDAYYEHESSRDYKPGGYHYSNVGDFVCDRYCLLKKLGWGHFSVVWLCYDKEKYSFKALKISKSARPYRAASVKECNFHRDLNEFRAHPYSAYVVKIYEQGKICIERDLSIHHYLTFELLGPSLYTLIKHFDHNGIPLPLVKIFSKQIIAGLDFLHNRCGIVHTDIKPENILLQANVLDLMSPDSVKRLLELNDLSGCSCECHVDIMLPELAASNGDGKIRKHYRYTKSAYSCDRCIYLHKQSLKLENMVTERGGSARKAGLLIDLDTKVKIADLGNACYRDDRYCGEIQTRQYRSPESIAFMRFDASADIWSFACMIFELAFGKYLFDPVGDDKLSKDIDHLHLIECVAGPFNRSFYSRSPKYNSLFRNSEDSHYCHSKHPNRLEEYSVLDIAKSMESRLSLSKRKEVCTFVESMINPLPYLRPRTAELLSDNFHAGLKQL